MTATSFARHPYHRPRPPHPVTASVNVGLHTRTHRALKPWFSLRTILPPRDICRCRDVSGHRDCGVYSYLQAGTVLNTLRRTTQTGPGHEKYLLPNVQNVGWAEVKKPHLKAISLLIRQLQSHSSVQTRSPQAASSLITSPTRTPKIPPSSSLSF